MLLIFRPFRIGHSVQVGGIQGTVKELSLFWTELVTPDNVQIIVPNGSVWGQPLRNFSFYPVRGIELHFSAGDTPDLDRALSSVRGLFESDARIVDNPAPAATLELSAADNSLQLVVKVWTSSGNVVGVRTDVIRGVRESLATPAIVEHSRAN
jgi:small conductance mechanosensitive channel